MPSMQTHSCELQGEGEGAALTCTDKITKGLQQDWDLNPLPLPSDFTTRPSLLPPAHRNCPTPLQTDLRSQQIGEKHLIVSKSFGRSTGSGAFSSILWCSKEGKNTHYFPPSSYLVPVCQSNMHPLFRGCICHLIRYKRESREEQLSKKQAVHGQENTGC